MPAVVPTHVQRAIVEARARDEKPSVVMSKMKVGTLPGLEGRPFPIKQRTFYNYWDRAKAELRAARGPKGQEGPTVIDLVRVDLAIKDRGADPDDPESIARESGLTAAVVRQCFEHRARKRQEHEERERARREETRREIATVPAEED